MERIKVVILSLSVISYTQAQQQQIEEQIEHSTQHTVEIQPHYYQFQSIGTNNLPPGIEGVFVGRPLRSPTPFPQRLTQISSTAFPTNAVAAVPGRPITPSPFLIINTQTPVSALPLTQSNDGFIPSPSAATLSEDAISKDNEISPQNNGIRNTVPIFAPNPTTAMPFSPRPRPNPPPPTEYEDYENFDYKEEEYKDYQLYNEIFQEELVTPPDLAPVASFEYPKRPMYSYYAPSTTKAPLVDDIIDVLPAETSLNDPNLQCYERSCDQNITGRMVSYERALEIIQTEEYLTAADIELITKRKKRSPESFVDPAAVFMPFSMALGAMGLASRIPPQQPQPPNPHSPYHHPYKMHFYAPPPYYHKPKVQIKKVCVKPPLVPLNVAQPGQPGGGAPPLNADPDVMTLVPPGYRAVAVFPPYLFPRTVPAKCVIYAEPDPAPRPECVEQRSLPQTKKSIFQQFKEFLGLDRLIPNQSNKVRVVEVPAFERLYGFGCKVTLVDKQQCQLGYSCDGFGNRIVTNKHKKRSKRQIEEFFSLAAPVCRTELSPLGCTPAILR